MMGQNTVFHFTFQLFRKSRDLSGLVVDHLRSYHNMAQKLAVIRIIVFRKRTQFPGLSNIMEHRSCDQKILIQDRISPAVILAEFHHA